MTNYTMLVSDVTDEDMETFSDLYKECYGMRPRFAYTKADFVQLHNRYDSIIAELNAEEERALNRLRELHGVNFENMMAYYDWDVTVFNARADAAEAAKLEKLSIQVVGIKSVIDRWEHGEIG